MGQKSSNISPEDKAALEAEKLFEAELRSLGSEARNIVEDVLRAADLDKAENVMKKIKEFHSKG